VVDGEEEEDAEQHETVSGRSPEEKKYRPPRIAEVVYDGEREAVAEREAKTRARMAARAARSRSVREMLAEVSGRPDEVRDDDGDGDGLARREVARMRRDEEERLAYEEENFTRLNVTREDRRRRRALERVAERAGHGDGGGGGGDPFADLMGVAERVIGKDAAGSRARRVGQERVDALDAIDHGLVSGGGDGGGGKGAKKKKRGAAGSGGKKQQRRR
jgi:hypothetical protein